MIKASTNLLLLGLLTGIGSAWSSGWLMAYRDAKAVAVHIVVLSDSTAHVDQTNGVGYGPNERANLWPYRLQSLLASTAPGGSHGTGLLTLEANAKRFDTDVWTVSTPYAYHAEIGPFQQDLNQGGHVPANGSTVQLSAGATAALSSQQGDSLWVYWASCPDSTAFFVEVDGKAIGSFGGIRSSHCTAKRVRVFKGTLGGHTASIKAGQGNAYLYAAEWTTGNGGVAVDNLAVGGATTNFYNSAAKLAYVHTIPNVGLAIIAVGINDFAHSVPLSTYQDNLATIVADLKKNSPGTSILIVSQYPVLADDAKNSLGLAQPDYWDAAQHTADQYKVGYFRFAKAWGSFAAVKSRGLLTRDQVHPSDKGGEGFSREVANFILAKSE